jgi:energy-coupling factor transporter ATP-binding protein EcfA2
VFKVYGQGTAAVHTLADVSLPVDEGSMVAVMGPNGSGKSTLLTIAGTLEEPTSGEVLIDGVPADQHPGGKPAVDPGGHAAHRNAARLAAGGRDPAASHSNERLRAGGEQSNPPSWIVSLPGATCAVSSAVSTGSTGPGCRPKAAGLLAAAAPPTVS